MSKYVTIEYLKEHSRLQYADCSDEYLEEKLSAAEEVVSTDLQVESLDEFCGADGRLRSDIKEAVVQMAASLYENREAVKTVQTYPSIAYAGIISRNRKHIG